MILATACINVLGWRSEATIPRRSDVVDASHFGAKIVVLPRSHSDGSAPDARGSARSSMQVVQSSGALHQKL